jgi:uncharacterized protein (TIGR03083 family)
MVGAEFHQQALKEQSAIFRAVALRADEDALVSTCPGWDVRKLVRHTARVYDMIGIALELAPDAPRPEPERPPEDFDAAVAWFDDRVDHLTNKISTMDPEQPVWSFFPDGTPSKWARRAAHEVAIHRLDVEYALDGLGTNHVHELIFDPAFAADGTDEMLSVLGPLGDWTTPHPVGRVLYHAADAGRIWLLTSQAGEPPEVRAPEDAALGSHETDATVAGTADALYRHVWGRPSTAVVSGDQELARLISGR